MLYPNHICRSKGGKKAKMNSSSMYFTSGLGVDPNPILTGQYMNKLATRLATYDKYNESGSQLTLEQVLQSSFEVPGLGKPITKKRTM